MIGKRFLSAAIILTSVVCISGYAMDHGNDGQTPKKYAVKGEMRSYSGTITKINKIVTPNGMGIVFILLSTDQGVKKLLLGPVPATVDWSNIKMGEGDTIYVKGRMGKMYDEEVLIVSELQKNGRTLKMTNGKMEWSNS